MKTTTTYGMLLTLACGILASTGATLAAESRDDQFDHVVREIAVQQKELKDLEETVKRIDVKITETREKIAGLERRLAVEPTREDWHALQAARSYLGKLRDHREVTVGKIEAAKLRLDRLCELLERLGGECPVG